MAKKEHVALTRCYFCGEADQILLATRYNNKGEPLHDLAPLNGKVVNMDPCRKCSEQMKAGVMLIGIDTAKSEPNWNKPDGSRGWMPNPHRNGQLIVVREEAIRKLFHPSDLAEWAIKHRFMFIEVEALAQIMPAQGSAEGEVTP